jgi:hypothetical protein
MSTITSTTKLRTPTHSSRGDDTFLHFFFNRWYLTQLMFNLGIWENQSRNPKEMKRFAK